jgi:hypothetical protein
VGDRRRGLRQEGDALVVRLSTLQQLNCGAVVAASVGMAVFLVLAEEPLEALFLLFLSAILVIADGNAILLLRSSVRATPNEVVIRNRLHTHWLAIGDIVAFEIEEHRWRFLPPPVSLGFRFWNPNTGDVGVVRTSTGEVLICEAVLGRPNARASSRRWRR